MQAFVRYHGRKLQTFFQKGQYFVATYQQQLTPLPTTVSTLKWLPNRLVGLVVKASASRAEDPGFESRLRRDFSEVVSY